MNILLIDDEADVRTSLSHFLGKLGHAVSPVPDGPQGLKVFHNHDFDAVITDIRMPGLDGIELLRRLKEIEQSPVDVIVITGHGDMENAIKALKYGAFDYLCKPINVRELAITLERSAKYAALRKNYLQLKQEFESRLEQKTTAVRMEADHLRTAYLKEIGLDEPYIYSEGMRQVMDQSERFSTDRSVPVLIQGKSGTGKELVARYIHHYAQGSKILPFVAINCGAISRELIEAELFGHEPGAFTGASPRGKIGKIEAASGGTLFLDEIGEMPLEAQTKLLRVLENRVICRVGGVKEIPVDVRFISATNKELSTEIEEGRFRLDLYYRINLGKISIPSLSERQEDILPLATRFISRAFKRKGRYFGEFTPDAEELLLCSQWPGNVRELKNLMERVALLSPYDVIDSECLRSVWESAPQAPQNKSPASLDTDFHLPAKGLDLEDLNARITTKALSMHHGNQTRTAKYLGISRRVLQGRIKKFGIA
ncbi:MAG: sigma-54-dependent transcriptional regulator [Thermodesulfobacteriota bacterium]